MQLPDMSSYRQITEQQYGEYTAAVWEPKQTDHTDKRRIIACLLEAFPKENQGKRAEKGRNMQKM